MNILHRFSKKQIRHNSDTIIGAIVITLSLVGIISILMSAFNLVSNLFDDSDKMESYENFLLPVVMMDPVPFNNILNMNDQFILQTSLWAVLLGESQSNFSRDENGLMLIPKTELDVAAVRLFGDTVVLNHRTFDDYDASYLYDPSLEAYRVPLIGKVSYSPKVVNATKNGNQVFLTVGYIAPGNIWSSDMDAATADGERIPEKNMLYDLVENDNGEGYYIKSVRDVPVILPLAP